MVVQAAIMTRQGQAAAAQAFLEESIRLFQMAGAAADLEQAEQLLAAIHVQPSLEEIRQ
jgi:hypothetical protein